jgi:hypothetical protein
MPNPWDRPLLPKRGDDNDLMTYAGVGWVTSQWERIEFSLARLFSIFVGRPDESRALIEYSAPPIFRMRFDALLRTAARFFISNPDQQLEGELHALTVQLHGFADRRNDIAHGMVFPIQSIEFLRRHLDPRHAHRRQFALISPFQTLKRDAAKDTPAYAYTSAEMNSIRVDLIELGVPIHAFRNRLLPPDQQASPLR